MSNTYEEVLAAASQFDDAHKLALANALMHQVGEPDPEIEALCLAEVKARYQAHLEGHAELRSYDEVMGRYLSQCK